MHSTCSDGRLAPNQLIDAIADAGIGLAALTDHDTVAGLASAAERATSRGVIFVPGIELTTYEHGQVIHVLGYGFEPGDEGLAERNAIAQQVWGDNQRRWIDALRQAGHELND